MIFAQVLQVTWMKTFDVRGSACYGYKANMYILLFFWRKNENVVISALKIHKQNEGWLLLPWLYLIWAFWMKALTWSGWDTTVANLVHWQIGSNLTDVYVSPAVSTWQITWKYRHTTDVCEVLHICSAKVHYHLVISGVFFVFFNRVSVSRCCTTCRYVRRDYNDTLRRLSFVPVS